MKRRRVLREGGAGHDRGDERHERMECSLQAGEMMVVGGRKEGRSAALRMWLPGHAVGSVRDRNYGEAV